MNGDLKFAKANGLRSQMSKEEFQSWKKSRYKPRNVQNTKQRYSFGTQKNGKTFGVGVKIEV